MMCMRARCGCHQRHTLFCGSVCVPAWPFFLFCLFLSSVSCLERKGKNRKETGTFSKPNRHIILSFEVLAEQKTKCTRKYGRAKMGQKKKKRKMYTRYILLLVCPTGFVCHLTIQAAQYYGGPHQVPVVNRTKYRW